MKTLKIIEPSNDEFEMIDPERLLEVKRVDIAYINGASPAVYTGGHADTGTPALFGHAIHLSSLYDYVIAKDVNDFTVLVTLRKQQ